MTVDMLEQLSNALADCVQTASRFVVAIRTGRHDRSGILWRSDAVVTSEQILPEGTDFTIAHNSVEVAARLAGRDPGTNVAVLRLAQPLGEPFGPAAIVSPRAGSLALIVGADPSGA